MIALGYESSALGVVLVESPYAHSPSRLLHLKAIVLDLKIASKSI